MKQLLQLLMLGIVVCMLSALGSAQIAAYNGFCQIGGTFVSTVGMNSTTRVQASYPKCTVTVYLTGTTTLATVYSNVLSSPLSNPFQANIDASILFFASTSSCYDIVTSPSTSGGTPVMPGNFTYTNVCLGGGSGGGGGGSGVGPGTVNQIAKFISPSNVGNSSGFDDGIGLVQWPNGLTSMGNAYGKLYPNSPNGTTANYLACIDPTAITVAEVTTCSASTNKAIGIVHAGSAGITGNAQVTMLGFDLCVFDNQTVVGDYVGPSTSVGGQCTDLGGTRPASFQGVGRVTTLNNGAGTTAIIDLGPWDLFSPGSSGAGNCGFNFANGYFSGGSLLCDQNVTDDGNGNLTAKSLGLTDATQAGFYYLKQGTQPAAAPLNTRMDTVPSSVTTYTVIHPGVPCSTIGQTEIVQSTSTDSNGHTVVIMQCGTAGGGGVEAQINGVDNANCTGGSCPLVDFVDSALTPTGMQITQTNPSGGQVKPVLNDGTTRAVNPALPTATVNGTPGVTDYKYAVAGCQDVNFTYCSALSPVRDVPTGAATITSVNSITLSGYADTLYGYRFYVVCRTSSGGTPATTGIIAQGVGKAFIDTGLAGDGSNCATKFATNNTILSILPCQTSFSPGGPSMPGAPCGIDAPPLTVAATSDEFTAQFGAPGDANDGFWTWLNQNSATATWTGGMLELTAPTRANAANFNCLIHPVPASTPFTYTTLVYNTFDGSTSSYYLMSGLVFYEQSSGKLTLLGLNNGATNPYRFMVENGTITTESAPLIGQNNIWGNPSLIRMQDTGTNIVYSWSADGIGWQQLYTQAVGTPFTTAPSHYGVCIWTRVGVETADFDYIRRTQ